MATGDKRISELTQTANAPGNGALPIDVPGRTETNCITIANLLQGYFGDKMQFEGDCNDLRESGTYYTTGHTINAFGTGLLVVFTSSISVVQFSVRVHFGDLAYRALLYNNGKLDEWTAWRFISFT